MAKTTRTTTKGTKAMSRPYDKLRGDLFNRQLHKAAITAAIRKRSPADRSWWLGCPRDGFTDRAYSEQSRMNDGLGAGYTPKEHW
jgi:hypothetical protein